MTTNHERNGAENMAQKSRTEHNTKAAINVLSTILDLVNICANGANIGNFDAKINIFAFETINGWKVESRKKRRRPAPSRMNALITCFVCASAHPTQKRINTKEEQRINELAHLVAERKYWLDFCSLAKWRFVQAFCLSRSLPRLAHLLCWHNENQWQMERKKIRSCA